MSAHKFIEHRQKIDSLTCLLYPVHCHHSNLSHSTHVNSYTYIKFYFPSHNPPLCKKPACLNTHLVMRIGVQLVVIDHKLHHCSMACLSCTVQHGVTIDVSAVEQRLHLGSQVKKSADMATLCSQVKSIPFILRK